MNSKLKQIIFISLVQLGCGVAFSQVPEPPAPTEPVKVEAIGEIIYDIVDEPAEYPGGAAALKEYLKKNLVYPESAREQGIEGSCVLQFVVSRQGYVSHVKVKKGVIGCLECDAEAVRIVKKMPKWTPAKLKGENVNSSFSMPVHFKLGK